MKIKSYEWIDPPIVHTLDLKISTNKKLGLGGISVLTYHYSVDQVIANNIKLDSHNCFNCEFSYNNTNSNLTCYTHKGSSLLGIKSKLRMLHKLELEKFDEQKFASFLNDMTRYNVNLLRLGAYGEPVLLGKDKVIRLTDHAKRHTGYTHQWMKPEYQWAKKYMMASTHSSFEAAIASNMGWRNFTVTEELDDAVNCPASKEAGYKSTCTKCSLCSGTSSTVKKSIFIKKH